MRRYDSGGQTQGGIRYSTYPRLLNAIGVTVEWIAVVILGITWAAIVIIGRLFVVSTHPKDEQDDHDQNDFPVPTARLCRHSHRITRESPWMVRAPMVH